MTYIKMRYGMTIADSGSKTLILWPLPAKEAQYTAVKFEACVPARFGSCAEVVTDGGGEWEKEFAAMLACNFLTIAGPVHSVCRPRMRQTGALICKVGT